jgi:5-methylcytosine-specific restriction endonuclease McrA
MPTYRDALRGYAFDVLKRDKFRCRYCGLDGKISFANWLSLSWDHLLPKEHPERDNKKFIVAACSFCNGADNHYFNHAKERGLKFDGMTRAQLVAQRKKYVKAVRAKYKDFWEKEVSRVAG